MAHVRHAGIHVGAQHWDTNLESELTAFAACGTSCGLLMANAVGVCWLHGLAPCFKIHKNKTRSKVSEDQQPRNGSIQSCDVKLQREVESYTVSTIGKKIPPTILSCLYVYWCMQGLSGNLYHALFLLFL